MSIKGKAAPKPPSVDKLIEINKNKNKIKCQFGMLIVTKEGFRDVRNYGNLVSGDDNEHIGYYPSNANASQFWLGYDVDYKNPVDPFRWNIFKYIIDQKTLGVKLDGITDAYNEKIDVREIEVNANGEIIKTGKITQTTLHQEAINNKKAQLNRELTPEEMARIPPPGGITLPAQSTLEGWFPKRAQKYLISPNNNSLVYFVKSKSSKDYNSLSHELFGHLWFVLNKVKWSENESLSDSAKPIVDPFGRPFTTDTYTFLKQIAQNNENPNIIPKSPTFNVSQKYLDEAKKELIAIGENFGTYSFSEIFKKTWGVLSMNYEILAVQFDPHNPFPRSPDPAAQKLVKDIVDGYVKKLPQNKQATFKEALESYMLSMEHRNLFSKAVEQKL